MTGKEIAALVELEIRKIKDPIILSALQSVLIKPEIRHMDWDYGPQTYPCWTVAKDRSVDTELVYCEYGFGPKTPWGLVGISDNSMGMDSGWYSNLEDAFVESWMAENLKVWDVVKKDEQGELQILGTSMTYSDAYQVVTSLTPAESGRYRIVQRQIHES